MSEECDEKMEEEEFENGIQRFYWDELGRRVVTRAILFLGDPVLFGTPEYTDVPLEEAEKYNVTPKVIPIRLSKKQKKLLLQQSRATTQNKSITTTAAQSKPKSTQNTATITKNKSTTTAAAQNKPPTAQDEATTTTQTTESTKLETAKLTSNVKISQELPDKTISVSKTPSQQKFETLNTVAHTIDLTEHDENSQSQTQEDVKYTQEIQVLQETLKNSQDLENQSKVIETQSKNLQDVKMQSQASKELLQNSKELSKDSKEQSQDSKEQTQEEHTKETTGQSLDSKKQTKECKVLSPSSISNSETIPVAENRKSIAENERQQTDEQETQIQTQTKNNKKDDLQNSRNDSQHTRNEVHNLRNDVHNLKNKVHNSRNEVHNLRKDVQNSRNDVRNSRNDVQISSSDLHDLRNNIQNSRNDIIQSSGNDIQSFKNVRPYRNCLNLMDRSLMEGLAKPAEMGKAERMMQKMGWSGGALGKKGEGLLEPLTPNIRYKKSTTGFGHEKQDLGRKQKETVKRRAEPQIRQQNLSYTGIPDLLNSENSLVTGIPGTTFLPKVTVLDFRNKPKNVARKLSKKQRKMLNKTNNINNNSNKIEIKSEKQTSHQRFKTNVLLHILEFVKDDTEIELVFDPNLKRNERKSVHFQINDVLDKNKTDLELMYVLSEKQLDIVNEIHAYNRYVLKTESEGVEPKRALHVYKEAPTHVYLVTPDDLREEEEEVENHSENSDETPQNAKKVRMDDSGDSKKAGNSGQVNTEKSITTTGRGDNINKDNEISQLLRQYLIEFITEKKYKEFRFLGKFSYEEMGKINELLQLMFYCLQGEGSESDFGDVFEKIKSNDFEFAVVYDNGSPMITKYKRETTAQCDDSDVIILD